MTMTITKERVQNDFNKLKDYARKCYDKKDYRQSLCAIETASKLMYTFNIEYTDVEMEKLLSDIAYQVLNQGKVDISKCTDKRIVFYDYFAIDNRGLTQQYIRALIDLEFEILFITYDDPNVKKSESIFIELNQYNKCRIYKLRSKDYLDAAKDLFNVINEFNASTALLHTAPWDVVGILTWSYFNKIERYLINITDHAFWLGRCCSDYILEFRSYGYNISKNYRNIPEDRLILLPYYPIQDEESSFQGFPFDAEGKKVIFSGGSLYKIYGSSIFFNTIKHIVENHENTIVLFAGHGNEKPFREFIDVNKLHEKVYLIAERKDISCIFQNCFFYLCTYPITGGLMAQLAVANKKIPVAYTDPVLKCNYLETLFINNNLVFTHSNLEEYYKKIDKLISDPKYKSDLEDSLDNLLIRKEDFAANLLTSMQHKSTEYSFEKFKIDIDAFSDLYIQMENDYLHEYSLIFIRSKNIKLLLNFKEYMYSGSWCALKKNIHKFTKIFNGN